MADIFADAARDIIESISDAMKTEEAVFTPLVGDPVTLDVYLDQAINPQPVGYDSNTWAQQHTIECLIEDLAAEPNKNETFLIGSTTYTVQEVFENDGYFYGCIVK